jgi:uncharacterized cupredoxin-like copper-binding protein
MQGSNRPADNRVEAGVRRLLILATAALLVIVPAGCGSEDNESSSDTSSGTTSAGEQSVELSASEYAFDPSKISIDSSGKVTFRVSNDGQQTHALEVEGNGIEEETEDISPGHSGTLTVDLKAGEYEFYCPIDGHRDQGMEGTLVVGGSSAGGTSTGGTDDDTDTDEDAGYGG